MSHGGGGSERWLVSYADFITLLMVLFVVLYSMGQTDIEKYRQLAESLKAAFSGGPVKIVDPGIDQAGGVDQQKQAAPIVIPGIPEMPVSSVEVASELTAILSAAKVGGAVSVQNNIEGILLSLSEKLVFTPGTADLNPDAIPFIDSIGKMLLSLNQDIRVIGYTDDSAPLDARYTTNWDLSFARAKVIAERLMALGISADHITISGRAGNNPLVPNDTPEHRAINNRVEIIIVYPVSNDAINLDIVPNLTDSGGQTQP